MAKKRKDFLKDLMSKSLAELKKLIKTYQKDLFELRMKNAVRSLKQSHLIGLKRKDIARAETVLNQKTKQESK